MGDGEGLEEPGQAEFVSRRRALRTTLSVADGIIWMSQHVHRDAMLRKVQVVKMRGQA